MNQMEVICTSLFQTRDGERLVRFFDQVESVYGVNSLERFGSEPMVVAYAYALFHSNNFTKLYNLLSTRNFDKKYFDDLTKIWYEAKYKEAQLNRKSGEELTAVERHRLRKRTELPSTIWDGEKTVYSFKDSSRRYLRKFFKEVTRKPNQEQRKELSRVTGLKLIQISNWFKNRRQRHKCDLSEHLSPSSSSSNQSSLYSNLVGVPFH
ncbi:hypothetical protein CRE_30662 [Caenorhabditis remanei]|uniref:Homeobox domain-containing protein n=1 Tax=Caenorhabditis remanei TaxID=31234 RepID=E3LTK8_CAERE|nr:hypothetical protein CRE_30662 [Caenorhabditis remanei]